MELIITSKYTMNRWSLEFLIAWRYLFNRTDERFISLISIFSFIGITLGVATLIIVMSVMNGFREKLINNIVGVNGHVNISSQENEIRDYKKIIEDLKKFPEIVKIIPLVQAQALGSNDENNVGLMVFGIEDLNDKPIIKTSIQEFDKILIGARLAESMNLRVNDEFSLTSSKIMTSILGDIPRSKAYEVGGIFETGIFDFDSGVVYMPLKQAQIFFQIYDSVNKIEINLTSPYISQKIMHELRKKYSSERGDLIINDWQDTNSHYLGALETEKHVMFLILSLIVLVAIFNVISSLVMMVSEKQKSIAILRSFGLTKHAISRIFIYCGMLIAITGTLVGTLIGIIISLNINSIKLFIENVFEVTLFDSSIYIFREMPSNLNWHDVWYIVVFSLIISLLAVIPPSLKAAEKDPASVLRYL